MARLLHLTLPDDLPYHFPHSPSAANATTSSTG